MFLFLFLVLVNNYLNPYSYLHFSVLTVLCLKVVRIRTNLKLLAAGLSKYACNLNFCCRQPLIIFHRIRAKLTGIKLGTKHVIYMLYQKLANFM